MPSVQNLAYNKTENNISITVGNYTVDRSRELIRGGSSTARLWDDDVTWRIPVCLCALCNENVDKARM